MTSGATSRCRRLVPSTGAGIATLAPIPEVPAGDIDLIAPLKARSMRAKRASGSSGNVNIAALHVVNAANIQVQGETIGIPVRCGGQCQCADLGQRGLGFGGQQRRRTPCSALALSAQESAFYI